MKKLELRQIIEQVLKETIHKVDGKYVVYPEKGGKRLGTHSSKKAAEKQLTAIHLNKEGVDKTTTDDIISTIKNNYSKYKNFGLRVIPKDVEVKKGELLRNSTQWTITGDDSGIDLGGASTVGIYSIKPQSIEKSLKIAQEYGSDKTDSQLILVGGVLGRRGQDNYELIIKNPIALEVWKK